MIFSFTLQIFCTLYFSDLYSCIYLTYWCFFWILIPKIAMFFVGAEFGQLEFLDDPLDSEDDFTPTETMKLQVGWFVGQGGPTNQL